MGTLSDIVIRDLGFLIGDKITLITIGKYEIRFKLERGSQITVYSRILYKKRPARKFAVFNAEGKKDTIGYSDVLDKEIVEISYQRPNFLQVEFSDDSILKVVEEKTGFESFLINTPEGLLFVFNGTG